MKTLLPVLLAVAFSGAAFADDDKEDRIAQHDQDQDGQLSRTEVAGSEELSARFDELDADSDGQLTEDEIDAGPIDDFDEIGDDPLEDDASVEGEDYEEIADEAEAEEEEAAEEVDEDWNS